MLTAEARKARNEYMRKYRQNMSEEQKKRQREYHAEWRKNNAERIKQHQATYWKRKAKEMNNAGN